MSGLLEQRSGLPKRSLWLGPRIGCVGSLALVPLIPVLPLWLVLRKLFVNGPPGARSLTLRGIRSELAGELQEADRCYKEAALIWSKFNLPNAKGQYLVNMLNLGSVRRRTGSYEDAKERLEHVLGESRSLGMRHLEFHSLRELLRLHRDLGNMDEANRCSIGMLALLEERQYLPATSRLFDSFRYGANPDRGMGRSRLLQRFWRPITGGYRVGVAGGMLAAAEYEAREMGLSTPQEVREHMNSHRSRLEGLGVLKSEEAKEIWDRMDAYLSQVRVLPELDNEQLGELEDLAADTRAGLGLDAVEARVFLTSKLGRLFAESEDLQKARKYCSTRAKRATKLGCEGLKPGTYYDLGKVYMKGGQVTEALSSLTKAVNSLESTRRGLLAEDSKLPLLGLGARVYENAVIAALQIDTDKAFELAERARSRAFLDIVGHRAARLHPRLGQAGRPKTQIPPTSQEAPLSLKTRRQLLTLGLHLVIVLLCFGGMSAGETSGHDDLFVLSGVTLLGYGLTLRLNPLPRVVASRIIPQTECPDCGQVIDLVGIWRCGCGFVSWRPRHEVERALAHAGATG